MGALTLDQVVQVVVDEADRMADMGFLPAVRRLVAQTAADRQVLLFSATLDAAVGTLAQAIQRDPVRHEVGPTGPDPATVHHAFWAGRSAPIGRSSPPGSSASSARRSCSAGPATGPIAWPSSSRRSASRPRPSTAAARSPSGTVPSRPSPPVRRRPSSPPTSPPAASTSTASAPSSTTTRRPTQAPTSTAPVARPAPARRGSSCRSSRPATEPAARSLQRHVGIDAAIVAPSSEQPAARPRGAGLAGGGGNAAGGGRSAARHGRVLQRPPRLRVHRRWPRHRGVRPQDQRGDDRSSAVSGSSSPSARPAAGSRRSTSSPCDRQRRRPARYFLYRSADSRRSGLAANTGSIFFHASSRLYGMNSVGK